MSMKNMAVMFGAMAMMRRLDQEEPLVLLYARVAYVVYVLVTALVYVILHLRIVARRDLSLLRVPAPPKQPSFADAMAAARADPAAPPADADDHGDKPAANHDEQPADHLDTPSDSADATPAPEDELMTVMEYDLRKLSAARRSWVSNACLLAAIHYKMESVSPLLMSSLMGLTRMLSDDQLVQIHLRGAPAVGPLARPFQPAKNPLADMLKDLQPKPEDPAAPAAAQGEDLHDDGDDDDDQEDDAPPRSLADFKDDHIKSDFDDEDDDADGNKKDN